MQQEVDWVKNKEDLLNKYFKNKTKMQGFDLYSLFFAFLNRKRFTYRMPDILAYLAQCLCLRSVSNNRRSPYVKKHFLLEKAEEKFMGELDAVKIVRTLRKFKMFAQAMLSQKHRLLLRF